MRFELRRWVDQRRIPKSIQLIPADITDFLPTKEHDDHEFHVMPWHATLGAFETNPEASSAETQLQKRTPSAIAITRVKMLS